MKASVFLIGLISIGFAQQYPKYLGPGNGGPIYQPFQPIEAIGSGQGVAGGSGGPVQWIDLPQVGGGSGGGGGLPQEVLVANGNQMFGNPGSSQGGSGGNAGSVQWIDVPQLSGGSGGARGVPQEAWVANGNQMGGNPGSGQGGSGGNAGSVQWIDVPQMVGGSGGVQGIPQEVWVSNGNQMSGNPDAPASMEYMWQNLGAVNQGSGNTFPMDVWDIKPLPADYINGQPSNMPQGTTTVDLGSGFSGISVDPAIPYEPHNAGAGSIPNGVFRDIFKQNTGPIFDYFNQGTPNIYEPSTISTSVNAPQYLPYDPSSGNMGQQPIANGGWGGGPGGDIMMMGNRQGSPGVGGGAGAPEIMIDIGPGNSGGMINQGINGGGGGPGQSNGQQNQGGGEGSGILGNKTPLIVIPITLDQFYGGQTSPAAQNPQTGSLASNAPGAGPMVDPGNIGVDPGFAGQMQDPGAGNAIVMDTSGFVDPVSQGKQMGPSTQGGQMGQSTQGGQTMDPAQTNLLIMDPSTQGEPMALDWTSADPGFGSGIHADPTAVDPLTQTAPISMDPTALDPPLLDPRSANAVNAKTGGKYKSSYEKPISYGNVYYKPKYSYSKPQYDKPKPKYGSYGKSYGSSISITYSSPLTYGKPRVSYGSPALTYGKPKVTYGKPVVTYGKPRLVYGKPKTYSKITYTKPRYYSKRMTYSYPSKYYRKPMYGKQTWYKKTYRKGGY